tara:strand:- start:2691 stop:2855 length:165 start_codon:yes stop_codon:yes gene_type:complete
MINDTQKQIIRQSSLKAAIDFYKLSGNVNVTKSDIIDTAYEFGHWCATGNKLNK